MIVLKWVHSQNTGIKNEKRNSQEETFCVHLQCREEPPWQHTPARGCERCPGVHSSQDQRHHKDLSPSSSNSGSFIQIQEQTNSASAWQQETRVQWVRASDQSGANRWTTPRLGNRWTGSSLGVNIQNAQVLAEQHMVSLLDLTTPAGRPRCHHVSQQSSRIRELPLFLPLLRHNEISFSVSRSTNLIAMFSYLGKPNQSID